MDSKNMTTDELIADTQKWLDENQDELDAAISDANASVAIIRMQTAVDDKGLNEPVSL